MTPLLERLGLRALHRVDPEALAGRDRFARRPEVDRGEQVVERLGRVTRADLPDADDGAEGAEQRLDLGDRRFVSAHHHREPALGRAAHAARACADP